MGYLNGRMGQNTKGSGLITRHKDRGNSHMQMEIFMKGNGLMIGRMEREYFSRRVVVDIMGNGRTIFNKDMELRNGMMGQSMRVTFMRE